jgi:hypothetical protein
MTRLASRGQLTNQPFGLVKNARFYTATPPQHPLNLPPHLVPIEYELDAPLCRLQCPNSIPCIQPQLSQAYHASRHRGTTLKTLGCGGGGESQTGGSGFWVGEVGGKRGRGVGQHRLGRCSTNRQSLLRNVKLVQQGRGDCWLGHAASHSAPRQALCLSAPSLANDSGEQDHPHSMSH